MDGNLACSRISSIISISGRKSRCLEQCLKFYRSILWLRCILTEWETPLSPFLSLSLVLLLTAVVIVTRGPETSLWPGWGDVPGPPGDGRNSLPSGSFGVFVKEPCPFHRSLLHGACSKLHSVITVWSVLVGLDTVMRESQDHFLKHSS